jgi:hypothetical protein
VKKKTTLETSVVLDKEDATDGSHVSDYSESDIDPADRSESQSVSDSEGFINYTPNE